MIKSGNHFKTIVYPLLRLRFDAVNNKLDIKSLGTKSTQSKLCRTNTDNKSIARNHFDVIL